MGLRTVLRGEEERERGCVVWLTLCANFVPVRRAGQGRAGRRRLDWNPALLSCQTEEEETCQPRSQRLSTISSNMDILLVPPAMSLDSDIYRIKHSRSLDQETLLHLQFLLPSKYL